MLDKIRGIWRKENQIFISSEYYNISFHVNEIESICIFDLNDTPKTPDDLPMHHATVVFRLKSGRKRSWYAIRLTKRKYNWLLKLIAPYEQHYNNV